MTVLTSMAKVYAIDDIHKDDKLYQDPARWDPSRYLPGREEDKKVPHAYVGWGSGLHPCRELSRNPPELVQVVANAEQWE